MGQSPRIIPNQSEHNLLVFNLGHSDIIVSVLLMFSVGFIAVVLIKKCLIKEWKIPPIATFHQIKLHT